MAIHPPSLSLFFIGIPLFRFSVVNMLPSPRAARGLRDHQGCSFTDWGTPGEPRMVIFLLKWEFRVTMKCELTCSIMNSRKPKGSASIHQMLDHKSVEGLRRALNAFTSISQTGSSRFQLSALMNLTPFWNLCAMMYWQGHVACVVEMCAQQLWKFH